MTPFDPQAQGSTEPPAPPPQGGDLSSVFQGMGAAPRAPNPVLSLLAQLQQPGAPQPSPQGGTPLSPFDIQLAEATKKHNEIQDQIKQMLAKMQAQPPVQQVLQQQAQQYQDQLEQHQADKIAEQQAKYGKAGLALMNLLRAPGQLTVQDNAKNAATQDFQAAMKQAQQQVQDERASQAQQLQLMQQQAATTNPVNLMLQKMYATQAERQGIVNQTGITDPIQTANALNGRTVATPKIPPPVTQTVNVPDDMQKLGLPPTMDIKDFTSAWGRLHGATPKMSDRETWVQGYLKDAGLDDNIENRTKATKAFATAIQQPQRPPQQLMLSVGGDGSLTPIQARAGVPLPPNTMTPARASALEGPTTYTKNMTERAPTVLNLADKVLANIDANEKQYGPLGSRWDEFTAGKIGLKNEGYTQYKTQVTLLQTALLNMHLGSKGGQQMFEHFKDLLDQAKQDPDNMRTALAAIKDYAQQVKTAGTVGSGENGALPSAPPGAPKQKVKWIKDVRGNPIPAPVVK